MELDFVSNRKRIKRILCPNISSPLPIRDTNSLERSNVSRAAFAGGLFSPSPLFCTGTQFQPTLHFSPIPRMVVLTKPSVLVTLKNPI